MLRAIRYDASRLATPPVPAVGAASAGFLRGAAGAINAPALARLAREIGAAPPREFWLALVPGASEQWGHHRAPPREAEARGVRISEEFTARLSRAHALLEADAVRFVLVSGGAIDPARPDYVEALRGREALIAMLVARGMPAPEAAERVLVDPWALHSTTNVRNGDKLCVELGLDRVLIATTMPPNPRLYPRGLPVLGQTSQGFYFLHHRLSTFDWRCRRALGYALGEFGWYETPARDGAAPVAAIAHWGFAATRLREDEYGA